LFREYEKTFRIVTPTLNFKTKRCLSEEDQDRLFTGKVSVFEKVDGANAGIVRGNGDKWTLQKRRGLADTGAHPQFSFFWEWAKVNNDKILLIPHGWIVYGELLWAQHHLSYDLLPSFFMVFDVWDGRRYHEDSVDVAKKLGFQHVPLLTEEMLDPEDLEKYLREKSPFSSTDLREGVVVKNYRKQMRGKLVNPKFVKELEEDDHWMKGPLKKNKLAPGVDVFA
jgi:RNA ligase